MTARSANSFLTSLLIHGLAVAGLFGYAYLLHDEEPTTKIIELVAGAGDDYGATEAPALGNPDSKTANPDAAPESSPIAPAPEPQPMEAVAAPPTTPAHPVQKAPDFIRQMNRAEKRTLAKIEKREKAEAEKEAKLEAEREKQAAAAVKNNQMTKEEFDRRFGSKANSAATKSTGEVKIAKIDGTGVAGGVRGGSSKSTKGAGGTALTREEGDQLDAYFSMLLARLKDAHQRPEGLSDLLTAKVGFYIDHDGTISGVSIVRSSGSPEFDQSVLSAFRTVGSIGVRPDSGGRLRREVTFKMRDD